MNKKIQSQQSTQLTPLIHFFLAELATQRTMWSTPPAGDLALKLSNGHNVDLELSNRYLSTKRQKLIITHLAQLSWIYKEEISRSTMTPLFERTFLVLKLDLTCQPLTSISWITRPFHRRYPTGAHQSSWSAQQTRMVPPILGRYHLPGGLAIAAS